MPHVVKTLYFPIGGEYRIKKWYIFTMDSNKTTCTDDPACRLLSCREIKLPEEVVLENHLLLISQLPCCAQIALPYWAKIMGRIINYRDEEVLLNVAVTLFDHKSPLTEYTDTIALNAKEKGEFEVRLFEYHNRATAYAILIEELEQL